MLCLSPQELGITSKTPHLIFQRDHIMTSIVTEFHDQIATTTPLPTWKLYDNPFYYYSCQHQLSLQVPPLSTPLSHLTLHPSTATTNPSSPELDQAPALIEQLKTKLESERRMRRKAESINKRLAREVAEERREHQAAARLCEELKAEAASRKAAVDRMKNDMEAERKMMRIAEVWREERVQMKLEEARMLVEKKVATTGTSTKRDEETTLGIHGNLMMIGCESGRVRSPSQQVNPHIKRAMVEEFPRVARGMGSRLGTGRHPGSNLECQRAQLRLLLKHKSPTVLGVAGPHDNLNLVVR